MYQSTKKKKDPDKKPSISYWSKQKVTCPVCKKPFPREEMLSGSGRTIAGELTDELHRVFEPSAKYGKVYPMMYSVGACPNCYCALIWSDFNDIDDKKCLEAILDDQDERVKKVETIFPHFNLKKERSLYDGAAMYYLAILTYEKVDLSYAPTFKRGMLSLRLAWLCNYLNEECPDHNFDYIAQVFYRKANFFYQQTLINETGRVETIGTVNNFGPDSDKNYGYDGLVYLCGLLEYKYGQTKDMPLRYKKLDECKRAIARIFGLGKSSKSKPGPLLEKSRDLYDKLTTILAGANDLDLEGEDDDDDIFG